MSIQLKTIPIGEEAGSGSGRVRLLSAIAGRVGSGRVGSGQRFGGSGRVQEKWPVDNSALRAAYDAYDVI